VTSIAKLLFWDLKHPTGRFNYVGALIRNIPGEAGKAMRVRWLRKYSASCGEDVVVDQGLRVWNPHQLRIGRGCIISPDCFLQAHGQITLGDEVMLAPGVKIWSVNHIFRDTTKPIHQQGFESEEVVIGDGCWLGANVFVMPGVVLPEGCVVAAGSVVGTKKYPPWSILAGFPARVIGNRLAAEPPTDSD
jgi:acetyltransferase-like isoleucine patch superfamily enzyme